MTSRSYFLGLVIIGYSTLTASAALLLSAAAAHSAGREMIPAFFSVLGVLCVVAALAGGRLLGVFVRVWDQHWDEDGASWVVREAEQILTRAEEQR